MYNICLPLFTRNGRIHFSVGTLLWTANVKSRKSEVFPISFKNIPIRDIIIVRKHLHIKVLGVSLQFSVADPKIVIRDFTLTTTLYFFRQMDFATLFWTLEPTEIILKVLIFLVGTCTSTAEHFPRNFILCL